MLVLPALCKKPKGVVRAPVLNIPRGVRLRVSSQIFSIVVGLLP